MSAAEAPRRIAELCDEAVHELLGAQAVLDQLKVKLAHDPWMLRELERIDDRIHNALGKLGD